MRKNTVRFGVDTQQLADTRSASSPTNHMGSSEPIERPLRSYFGMEALFLAERRHLGLCGVHMTNGRDGSTAAEPLL